MDAINQQPLYMQRAILFVQLIGTLLSLAFIPGNLTKATILILLWITTFRPISKPEQALFFVACCFFTLMNALSLKQGIFVFSKPDILRMPIYELFMWGFYLLHTLRMVNGTPPQKISNIIILLALLYAVVFGVIADQDLLLLVTASLLIVGLIFFHEKLDLAYTVYMILLGAAIEYTGVISGQWYYSGDPWGGVPLWFITLWGGVGLFLRRLVMPVMARYG